MTDTNPKECAHCWHPSETGQGPVYCYHCEVVKPGTEPAVSVQPIEAKEPEAQPVKAFKRAMGKVLGR